MAELGKLKARIREKGCNPSIPMVLPGSNQIIWVTVQKSALMAELDKVFPTRLMFDGDKLMPAKGAIPKSEPAPEPEAEEDDLLGGDDLLAGEPEVDDDEDLLA